MRLRQLAITQSIIFLAPPEVHQSIMNFRCKTSHETIDSEDVIIWLLEQTCCNIEQLQPLYVSQGLEYCRRYLAARKYHNAPSSKEQRQEFLRVLEQPEQFSLEKLYAPDHKTKSQRVDTSGNHTILTFVEKLEAMKNSMRHTGDAVQALAHQEVEQEREVQIEVVRDFKFRILPVQYHSSICHLLFQPSCFPATPANATSYVGDSPRITETQSCISTPPWPTTRPRSILRHHWSACARLPSL